MALGSDNFFNIGYFLHSEFPWSENGGGDSNVLNFHQKNLLACTNFYINGGFIESEHTEHSKDAGVTVFGPRPLKLRRNLRMVQPNLMSTSFATPLALSMANHLIQEGIFASIPDIKRTLSNNFLYPTLLDPLKFEMFELYSRE